MYAEDTQRLTAFLLQSLVDTPEQSRRELFHLAVAAGREVSISCINSSIKRLHQKGLVQEMLMVTGSTAHGAARYRYKITRLGDAWLKAMQDDTDIVETPSDEPSIQSMVTFWSLRRGTCGGYYGKPRTY